MSHEELYQKYISATLTLEDKEELKELLKTDREAGREFAEYIQDTALYLSVAEELALKQKAVDLDKVGKLPTTSFKVNKSARTGRFQRAKTRTPVRVAMAIAAAFVVSGILFYNLLKASSHVADIAVAEKISLDRAGIDLTFGDKSYILKGDKITALEDVTISVKDGSTVLLRKGSACSINETQTGIEVRHIAGRSQYKVSKQIEGRNFKVITNNVRTTVIGTEFTVDTSSNRSKVRVTEGTVKVDNLSSASKIVTAGEFAVVDATNTLSKKVAYQTMNLGKYITDAEGKPYDTEAIEEKPYLLFLYAEKFDPASRSFIHKLKRHYEAKHKDFEVVFMNNKESFAADYEMPWACIDAEKTAEVEKVIGQFKNSFSLNMVLTDQHGNVLAKSVKGNEWIGTDFVLDALDDNLNK